MNHVRLPFGKMVAAGAAVVAILVAVASAPTALAASSTISTSPVNINPAPLAGSDFTITVTENTAATTTGAQTDLTFNPTYFQINPGTVVYGAGYTALNWVQTAGTGGQTLAQAITEANSTGTLKNVAAYVNGPPGTATLAAGPATFFTVQFHTLPAYHHHPVTFTLGNAEVLDAAGNSNSVSLTGTTTGSVGGIASLPNLPTATGGGSHLAIWLLLAAGVVGAGAFVTYRRAVQRGAQA